MKKIYQKKKQDCICNIVRKQGEDPVTCLIDSEFNQLAEFFQKHPEVFHSEKVGLELYEELLRQANVKRGSDDQDQSLKEWLMRKISDMQQKQEIQQIFEPAIRLDRGIIKLGDWLNSYLIEKVLLQIERNNPNFKSLGWFCYDQFPKIQESWFNNNKYKYVGGVVNTCTKDQVGKHWLSVVITKDKVYYNDSQFIGYRKEPMTGTDIQTGQQTTYQPEFEQWLKDSGRKLVINKDIQQNDRSSCGYYALYFIYKLQQDKYDDEQIFEEMLKVDETKIQEFYNKLFYINKQQLKMKKIYK